MKNVQKSDFYEVRLMGPFGPAQLSSLTDLYLPICGSAAFSAYLGLREDESARTQALVCTHEGLFARLALSSGEFFDAMEKLEALALVSTFHKEEKNRAFFVYCLYSPKLPGPFFEDVLLMGALRGKIGEKAVEALERKYAPITTPEGFADVSAVFPSVFRPNYDDPSFRLNSKKGLSEGEGKIRTDFDYSKFISIVQKNGIAEETLSEAERKAIAQLGTLYALDPESMFEIFLRCFQAHLPYGNRLDREKLGNEAMELLKFPYLRKQKKEVSPNSGSNNLAAKIRLMDSVSPSQYLYYLQDGHSPASGDLKIAAMLMEKMGLSAPLTNAVMDYVLQTNDNILSKASCEKLAAAVLREGCKTSRDALDFLNGISEKRRGYKRKPASLNQNEKRVEEAKREESLTTEDDEEVTAEMVKKALDELYNK